MRAAVDERYGPPEVVAIREVPTPNAGEGEVLIRTRATTVSTGDWRARSLEMPPGFGPFGRLAFGITRPRKPILGTELSGVIEAVGAGESSFKVGDEVFALGSAKKGFHAEFRTIPASGLVARKPANLSFEQAAALSFGGVTIEDFTANGETHDVIVDTVGNANYSRVKKSLAKRDRLLVVPGGITPVIDQTYPFERIVDAHRRVETGRKRGRVVVTIRA